jgi:hypothetical protein
MRKANPERLVVAHGSTQLGAPAVLPKGSKYFVAGVTWVAAGRAHGHNLSIDYFSFAGHTIKVLYGSP